MKRLIPVYILSLMALTGCAGTSALAPSQSAGGSAGVFEERGAGAELLQKEAGLDVTAVLKTHEARQSFFADSHGTPGFSLRISIDGQDDVWPGAMRKERGRSLDLKDPESGNGIRYRFHKPLRLKAGVHRIVIALPEDGVSVAREIVLDEGRVHSLVIEPVYRAKQEKTRPGFTAATFKEGVRTFRLLLDGKKLEG